LIVIITIFKDLPFAIDVQNPQRNMLQAVAADFDIRCAFIFPHKTLLAHRYLKLCDPFSTRGWRAHDGDFRRIESPRDILFI